jgi:hypothetical protein
MKYIALSGIDPFSEKIDAVNTIYIRPHIIVHIEGYSGMMHLVAYGPDGRVTPTGKFKQVLCGSMLMLASGGTRIVSESPRQVLDLVETDFE